MRSAARSPSARTTPVRSGTRRAAAACAPPRSARRAARRPAAAARRARRLSPRRAQRPRRCSRPVALLELLAAAAPARVVAAELLVLVDAPLLDDLGAFGSHLSGGAVGARLVGVGAA